MFWRILICAAIAHAAATPAAELARSIHDASLDPQECYRVRDLSFRKDEIRFYFTDGYLIFSKPVQGQRISAVFTTEVEGGDGELILTPPTRSERQSLASFTWSPNLDEHVAAALMVFTNGTAALLKESMEKDGSGKKDPEMGPKLAEKWSPVLANIRDGFELRMVDDLLSGDSKTSGFLFFGLAGKEHGNFDLIYDPRAREQIVMGQMAEKAGRARYNIWTSFTAKSVRTGALKRLDPGFALTHFSIDATVDANLHMKAATKVTVRVGAAALRSFPFEIASAMKITGLSVDGSPNELLSLDSVRGKALRGSQDDSLLVVTPEPLAAGSEHEFLFEHEGDVISTAGNGVYFVGARATWYPRSTTEFSTYDLTFHYPKKVTLVTPGDLVDDHIDGETRITHRQTKVAIRFAGFNLGEYERVSGDTPGFKVDVYGNRALASALQPKPVALPDPTARPMTPQQRISLMQAQAQASSGPADPLARLRDVSANVTSALEFYSRTFGAPALKTLTVAPIPATFGQGFPGLVYLSTISYLDPLSRPVSMRDSHQQVFFSDLMVAHEVAHQWWGNVVITSSYQDEWLIEALSNYSALLWLEKKNGPKAVESVLDEYRARLLAKDGDGRTVESAGPIVWGARLESSNIPDAWRSITYEKGAWILHMLRRRMGDERFLKMLAELRRRYEFKSITTEDFRAFTAEFLPPHSLSGAIDSFFDNWVYETGIPSLKVQSSVKGLKVSGTVTQTGVDNDFSVDVPVEIQFARGAPKIVWVRTSDEAVPFSATATQAPVKISIGSYNVLAKK